MVPISQGSFQNITSTTALTTVPTILTGFYVNSTTSGTIVLKDGGSSGTVVSGTITPAIGWHFFPASFKTSLHATIANTIDVTFVYNPVPVT